MPTPRSARLLGILLLSLPPAAGAQDDTATTVPHALALVRSNQFPEARRMLETLAQSQPENGRVWYLLGIARFKVGDLPGALEANRRAMEFERPRPAALYNTGLVFAALGQADSAFAYLFEAKETNRLDLTQIGTDSDAVPLRNDPRFRRLFPSPEEYAHPFVEPATNRPGLARRSGRGPVRLDRPQRRGPRRRWNQ